MKKSNWIISMAASTVLALAALPAVEMSIAAGPPAIEVKIDNFSFTPAMLTVKVGTQVTWIQWRRHSSYGGERRPEL